MRKYRKMKEDSNRTADNSKENIKKIEELGENLITTNKKRLKNFDNLDEIIKDIDKEFAEKTGIFNKKDQTFLWTAVALQTLRWYLLEYDFGEWTVDKDSREKASEGGKREEATRKNYLNENKDNNKNSSNFIPWTDYFKNAVPYDAMKDDKSNMEGVKNIIIESVTAFGKNLSPSKHHSATLGHDPILGYFFGTINIMTSTITYNKTLFPTNKVEYPLIKEKVEFLETFFTSIRAGMDDYKRIPAAIIRQAMHMASDTNSTMGLPIPFLNATTQQKFLEQGWNSNELVKNLGKFKDALAKNMTIFLLQLLISYFINIVIGNLHLLFYDEEKDGNLDLYNIRTQKIIATSSTISSVLNIAYVGTKIYVGYQTRNMNSIKDGIKKIDLGGYINTVHQIVENKKLQERIRREYLEEKLYEKFLIERERDKNE